MPHNVLYAWELGANFGHVGSFMPVARSLRQKGYALSIALPSESSAAQLLDAEGIPYVFIPSLRYQIRNSLLLNYADMLSRSGYTHHAGLLEQTRIWRKLMQDTQAQVVLIDHAPTAILAARTLQLKAMYFSTGFAVPPPQFPTPSLQTQPIPKQRLSAAERPVVVAMNSVLAHYGQTPIKGVGQLFDITDNTLLGVSALDHYPQRPPAQYWGLLPDAGGGQNPNWPHISGKRIFAYLRADNPHFESICSVLRDLGQATLVFCPDGQNTELARTPAPHIAVTHQPVNLARVVQEADIAMTYGNFWTTTYFLHAGIPLLILPVFTEQYLLAKRIVGMGAALMSEPDSTDSDLHAMLAQLLAEPRFADNAQKFKREHITHTPEQTVERIVQRIEELANSGNSGHP